MSINKKNVKKIFTILLIILFFHYAIPLCFIGKEQIKMRIDIKEILLPIYFKYGYKMELGRLNIDREKKIFRCNFSINYRKMFKEMNTISNVYKSINNYLNKNKDYFLNDNYEILIFFHTKQDEFIYLTNGPLFKEQKGLSKGLKHAYMYINGDISLLKDFQDLEAMRVGMTSDSDLSVLNNFSNLKYIAFEEKVNQKRMNAVHKILPECIVKDSSDMHPSWYEN